MKKTDKLWAQSCDFTLLKKLKGSEKIRENNFKVTRKTIEVTRFVEQNFDNSLYNYQHGDQFIYGLEEKSLNPYLNDDKAEYLFIFHFGMPDQKIFPFTEKELMEFAGMKVNTKRNNRLIGFILYDKLCEHSQNYYIDEVDNIVSRYVASRDKKKDA